jgi:hypothetical protein
MTKHDFWNTGIGDLLLILMTLVLSLALTFAIARVNIAAEAGILFPVLVLIVFLTLSGVLKKHGR